MTPTIQLQSGAYFDFREPRFWQITIEDIAHALSNICRFTGHVREFYSVAQHSVLVSNIVPAKHALAGLLHDATEAYIGDMSSPLKTLNPAYKEIEHRIWAQIAMRFKLPWTLPAAIKEADNIALVTERRDLMPNSVKHDPTAWAWTVDIPLLDYRIHPVSPSEAKAQFLKRFKEITVV